ncbi:MAG: polysaccharide biosynthesis protein [Prevotella sp.]|nr:polysaccharide biosynthesis protein [Prevotella sp.]
MSILNKLSHWYFSKDALPYWCVFIFDCLVVIFSGLTCYTLDHGAETTSIRFVPLVGTLSFYLVFYIIGFRIMHTYSGVMRYTSFSDISRIAMGNFIGVAIIAILRQFFNFDDWFVPIRMRELASTFALATIIMWTARMVVKYMFEYYRMDQEARPVFIYGVKNGGTSIARAINTEETRQFRLCGFISDAEDLVGKELMGVRVYRNDGSVVQKMTEQNVKTLLISPLKQKALTNNPIMVDQLIEAGISILIMNTTTEWDGKSDISTNQLKEVEIEDLLPRDEIKIDLKAVGDLLRGKSIMITGSAGSIGSEIARQVAEFMPERIIMIDQAETPQHDMRLFMKKEHPHIKAETIVTSICNQSRMETLFKMYKPDYLFHAAAYKHVPMMEDNPCEAIQNNVNGTRIMADLSVKYGVKKFVMISTDKAVNPTNVMGCSKRICEIYVQSLDKAIKSNSKNGITQFVTTRFGNVLGSNGSVIPLFKEQIKNGGPLTVTHPDIFRYFMLIPEACKLVLEAGTKGHGGEIFVFDMGAPVKIADLARRMIKLSGAKNIDIKFTGLRDGEKLYEEVLNDQEITKPTFNNKIKIATVREYDFDKVRSMIDKLITESYRYDDMETVKEMKEIVPEYKSNHSKYEVLDTEEQTV